MTRSRLPVLSQRDTVFLSCPVALAVPLMLPFSFGHQYSDILIFEHMPISKKRCDALSRWIFSATHRHYLLL